MTQIPTTEELQDFALNFDEKIVRPLVEAGYDNKYNVFDILNISRQELRHSDFLAFLFNPKRSGDIGWQFLKSFLTHIAQIKERKLDFYDMPIDEIKQANVYREVTIKNGRIDILIELEIAKEKAQKIVIAIENKVDSGEHDNQLKKYKEFLFSKRYEDYKKVMLYLSPDKEPTDDDWISIDYEDISSVLKKVKTEAADPRIKILIDDYERLIRSEFDMLNNKESELKKQAFDIYKNNQKVLEFIYKSRLDWRKTTSEYLCELLEQKGATIVTENSNGELVESSKRDMINIMFRIKELDAYPTHYFQINVREMYLLFIHNSTKRQYKKQWLWGNRQESNNKVEQFQEWALSDTNAIQDDCKLMIDRIFQQNGAIEKALASLKK